MTLRSQNSLYHDPEMKEPELFHYTCDRLVLNLTQIAKNGWAVLPEKRENHVRNITYTYSSTINFY